jgi:hypothetical protein
MSSLSDLFFDRGPQEVNVPTVRCDISWHHLLTRTFLFTQFDGCLSNLREYRPFTFCLNDNYIDDGVIAMVINACRIC